MKDFVFPSYHFAIYHSYWLWQVTLNGKLYFSLALVYVKIMILQSIMYNVQSSFTLNH